jgi:ABC-2 type transport system permease protein
VLIEPEVVLEATDAPVRRRPPLLSLSAAVIRRDFAVARSYRIPFVFDWVGPLFQLVLYWALGRLVGGAAVRHGVPVNGYFTFVVVGLVSLRLTEAALTSHALRLRNEQVTGTLETLLAGPSPAWLIVLADSAYDLLRAVISGLMMLGMAALLFGLHFHSSALHVLFAVAGLFGTVGFVLALGLLLAALTILVQSVTGIVGFAVTILALAGGVWFPLEVLPQGLQTLAHLIPFTWGLEIQRDALLHDHAQIGSLVGLVACDAVLIGVGLGAIELAVRRARHTGTLGLY